MNKIISRAVLLISGLCLFSLPAIGQTKPVRGTWINLSYQDVRNKYMNPAYVEYKSAEFWEKKITELSEFGMEYIVIMAVANNRQSFYPSDFMAPAYAKDEKSPVEAIMETADKHKMKVFMSSGWAVDQDDDLRKPEIKETQEKIMIETSAKFKHHKSFFGWYLPVEDSFEPYLSDHAVEAVNTLADKARTLTPGKQIMISPYGICYADINNKKFAEQIKKLKVDIIAYQDEVGCVREPMPMKRMKENFSILGKIHRETNIQFWANIESFTWEKGDNDRESALIPAAFPRYLSQMTGVSLAGAKEVISFSIYGIFDKPDSEIPIGQPCYSAKAYQDFMDWKEGKGRWPLLETTFKGEIVHSAINKKITSNNHIKDIKRLTDKKLGQETTVDNAWVNFNTRMDIVIDMGKEIKINTLAGRFLHYRKQSVALPSFVHFYVSKDNKEFVKISTVAMEASKNDKFDCWIDIALADNIDTTARYIKVEADSRENNKIYCDEIFVNPN